MAQPSVLNYFNNRKRTLDESKINLVRKVLILDGNECSTSGSDNLKSEMVKKMTELDAPKIIMPGLNSPLQKVPKKPTTPRIKKTKSTVKPGNIEKFFNNMTKSGVTDSVPIETVSNVVDLPKDIPSLETPKVKRKIVQPKTPTKTTNALDKLHATGNEPTISELKHKLSRSSRLAALKASMTRFKQAEKKLEAAEQKTLALKNFKAIELEVNLSPSKSQSPQKSYLSPKKDSAAVCRNLFGVASPTKNALPIPSSPSKHIIATTIKESLTLPYKYRRVAEIFRAIDTVSQILFNRKETITFRKLKPSIEKMLKHNITEQHLAQIKYLYPDSFIFQQEKLREFGTGTRHEQWELTLIPNIAEPTMTAQILLDRRRKLFSILIEKLKDFHEEFLATLDPPMNLVRADIKRWHPLFDIEKVPDIETSSVPQPPDRDYFTTGSQVLEKARTLFSCNTRMERALEKLKDAQSTQKCETEVREESVLKGIPKALLEKVRQRQAAKALESMTRSVDKEKEAQLYSRLPEIARLARNVFVAEKKNVLPLDLVIDKLFQSSRIFLTRNDIELYLKTIAKEEKDWIKLELVRGATFIKIAKNYDISLIINKLQSLAEQKMT